MNELNFNHDLAAAEKESGHQGLTKTNRKIMRAKGWRFSDGKVAGAKGFHQPRMQGGGYERTVSMPEKACIQVVFGCPSYHGTVAWREWE